MPRAATSLVPILVLATACGADDVSSQVRPALAATSAPEPKVAIAAPPGAAEVEQSCGAGFDFGELPSTTGGVRADGRWVNEYTVVNVRQLSVEVPIDASTLKAEGELCCYCNGRVSLAMPEIANDSLEPFGTEISSGAVCDWNLPSTMLDVAKARGGTLPALLTVVTQEAIQRDADGRCLTGVYQNLTVQFVDCATDEAWMTFSTYTFEPTGEVSEAVCADQ